MTIRRTPSDFLVEERLDPAHAASMRAGPGAGATHAVFLLRKTSLVTPEAVQAFGRAIGARPGMIDYAGLKDKHAQTCQHVSVPTRNADEAERLPRESGGERWSASLVGWSAEPMTAERIVGNRFTIVVRDLSKGASEEMARRARLLAAPDQTPGLLVVNYFGDQRFGSARHGQGFAGPLLMRGDFEGALKLLVATPARKDAGRTRQFTRMAATAWGDWKGLAARLPRVPEKRAIDRLADGGDFKNAFASLPYLVQTMAVEAYQSHLWNRIAHRLAGRIATDTGQEPVRTDDPFGEMLFPPAATVAAPWASLDLPVLARKTVLAEPWGHLAAEVLAEEGVQQDQLRVPGLHRPFFGEALRPLFARATEFQMSPPEPDELSSAGKRLKRVLAFDLPRGAYATVVLRALGQ